MQKIFELLRSWYQEGEQKETEQKPEGKISDVKKDKSKTQIANSNGKRHGSNG
jgi:hypothetical protein